MAPDELLARVAVTLRRDIGPAVGEPYPKTQAFMAAVVLEKLAGQLRLAAEHAEAEQRDRAALVADLAALVEPGDPPAVQAAVEALAAEPGPAPVCRLIEALYAANDLPAERFELLLGRVRAASRARLDRQLAYAA